MSDRSCIVADCLRPNFARGYCRAHYRRLNEWGDVREDIPLRYKPTAAERDDIAGRILSRCVRQPNGCIEWIGKKTPLGYARVHWRGQDWFAHRAIWTATNGPIPDDDDWTIDHLCRNRACQNVKHMEVVTRTENAERGGGLRVAQARNAMQPACKAGHLWVEHGAVFPSGQRYCRVCSRAKRVRNSAKVNAKRRAERRARREAQAVAGH